MNIRVVIVDDEPLARDAIRMHLMKENDIRVIGEAGDGPGAVETVKEMLPDLLFLDIQLPGFDGFDVLEKLARHHLPAVVFVTAYDRYALRAFEVHALEYLLKPFTHDRFQRMLQFIRHEMSLGVTIDSHRKLISLLDTRSPRDLSGSSVSDDAEQHARRLAVSQHGRIVLLNVSDIDWVEASGNYVTLHAGPRSYEMRSTLIDLLARLPSHDFLRIHRSTAVNVRRIVEIVRRDHSDHDVRLNDGTVLKLSRHYRHSIV